MFVGNGYKVIIHIATVAFEKLVMLPKKGKLYIRGMKIVIKGGVEIKAALCINSVGLHWDGGLEDMNQVLRPGATLTL